MTPNNIVNMALLKGLDMIAVTDHNSCGNVPAVMAAAGGELLVIPGMELETCEEVHLVCYFPTLEAALEAEKEVKGALPPIKNRTEIFGNQYYMNEKDEIVGEEEALLVSATSLDVYSAVALVKAFGGAAVPAHIDRASYSVLSNLGFMPPDLEVSALEITEKAEKGFADCYANFDIITNSDAHYLENIAERQHSLDLMRKSAQTVVDFLCRYN